MKSNQILSVMLILLFLTSCKSNAEKQKEQNIEKGIVAMQTEMEAIQNQKTESQNKLEGKALLVKAEKPQKITKVSPNKQAKLEPKVGNEKVSKQTQSPAKKVKEQSSPNKIIGVWEVKNDYYMAIYEVEEYEGKFIGKIHYYNDGTTEYKGENTEKDYFLEGLTYKDGKYKGGKMHMPDGSNYQVVFQLKNNNELEAKMTVEGTPYTEIWKRQKTK